MSNEFESRSPVYYLGIVAVCPVKDQLGEDQVIYPSQSYFQIT